MMNQNMFKRAWLSVKRKLGRSIILTVIFCVMGSLVLATIIIKSAVHESVAYAKSTIDSTVTLQADMATLRDDMRAKSQHSSTTGSGATSTVPGQAFTRPTVNRSVADQIATSDYVKDYTYSINTSAKNDKLTVVESVQESFGGPKMMGNNGFSPDTTTEAGDFSIFGINAYAYIDAVKSGQMQLTEGDYFNESDSNSVIISVDLAEANNFTVGDTLQLTNIYNDKSYKLQIIGIYDNSSNFFDANTIYMNIDTAENFLNPDTITDGDFAVENVTYILADSAEATNFITWINETFPELAEQNIVATEDTSLYEQMAGPIESVGSFATLILVIVLVASVVIITLIVVINVKDRRYEMGVLLSLGATKANIIGQFFVELVIVGTIAFIISCFSATMLAGIMGQGILDSQIASLTQESETNFGRPLGQGMGRSENNSTMPANNTLPDLPDDAKSTFDDKFGTPSNVTDQTITEIDVNAKPTDYILLFVCGYIVIAIALILPAINVMHYQPKQILQGKE